MLGAIVDESPSTIRVTHDQLAASLIRTGQNLIELGMQLEQGFDVEITYRKPTS